MKNKKDKTVVVFFTVATIVTFILRFVQIVIDVDKTGGQLHSAAVSGILPPLTLIVILIIGAVMYFVSGKGQAPGNIVKNRILGISALLVSVTVLNDALSAFIAKKDTYSAAMSSGVILSEEKTLKLLLNLSYIQLALSALMAVFFIGIAMSVLRGKQIGTKSVMNIFSVFLPLWCCIRLAIDYVELTNSSILTEKIYDSLTVCAMALFFMAYIRIFAGTQRENTRRSVISFGLLSVMLAVIFALPRYIMVICFGYTITATSSASNLANLAIALYISLFLISLFKTHNLPEENVGASVEMNTASQSEETEE